MKRFAIATLLAYCVMAAATEPVFPNSGASGIQTVVPTPHAGAITAVERLGKTKRIATASMDGYVKIWDEESGTLVSQFSSRHRGPVVGLAAHPRLPGQVAVLTLDVNESALAAEGGAATVRIVDLERGETLRAFAANGGRMRFSPDGRWIAITAHTQLSVWDAATGKLHVALLTSNDGAVFAGRDTIAYRRGGNIVMLDLVSGAATSLATRGSGAFALSRDGALLAEAYQKSLRVWRLADRKMIAERQLLLEPQFIYFADDHAIIAGGHARSIFANGAMNAVFRLDPASFTVQAFTTGNSAFTYVADGGTSILLGLENGTVRRLVAERQQRLPSLGVEADDISALTFSASGRFIAAGFGSGGLAVWEPGSNWHRVLDPLNKIQRPPEPVFSDNDKQERYSATYRVGEGVTNAPEIGKERVLDIAFIGPERLAVLHASGKTEVLNITDGRILARFELEGPVRLLTSEQPEFGIAGRKEVLFVATDTLSSRRLALPGVKTRGIAVSPDGRRLRLQGFDATVEIDALSGAELARLPAEDILRQYRPDGTVAAMTWNQAPSDPAPRHEPMEWADLQAWFGKSEGGALATRNGKVRIWTRDGKDFRASDLSTGSVIHSLALSPDGRALVAGSSHGRLAIYSTRDASLLGELVSYDYRGWLAHSSAGAFDGSYAAWDQVRGTYPAHRLTPVQPVNLFGAFYQPQLLARLLSDGPESTPPSASVVQAVAPTVNIISPVTNFVRDSSPPTISTVRVNGERRLDERGEPISFRVNAPNEMLSQVHGGGAARTAHSTFTAEVNGAADIAECRVFRNRRLIRSLLPTRQAGGRARFSTDLPLSEGENTLSVYCFTRAGLRSNEAEVRVYGADSLRAERHAHVFAIGIDSYVPQDRRLKFAVADAKLATDRLQRMLRSTGQYADVHITRLLDGEATATNILQGLRILAGSAPPATGPLASLRRSAPADSVFIYFAGHGGGFAGDYRLIAADGVVGAAGTTGTVSAAQIRDTLEPMLSDRSVIILDACESGQVLDQIDPRIGPLAGKNLAQLAYDKAMFVISASQSQQAAHELTQLGHGVFSHVLFNLAASDAADQNRDGMLTIREWLEYGQSETPSVFEAKRRELDVLLGRTARAGRSVPLDEAPTGVQTPRLFIPDPNLAREFLMMKQRVAP